MMVSTRGRYALRVLIDLAAQEANGFVPLKDVAARQGISQKYLESIMAQLVRGGFVEGVHGRGGGYRLALDAALCRVGDVLALTEGSLAPVACLTPDAPVCEKRGECRTYPLWAGLDKVISEYLSGVTLSDLLEKKCT